MAYLPLEGEEFRAHLFFKNKHLQTMIPKLLRQVNLPKEAIFVERFDTPDHDFLEFHWVGPLDDKDAPICLILHGLEGSMKSSYCSGMAKAMAGRGFRACVMHFRGCTGEPNKNPSRSYHFGDTDDVRLWVNELKRREPECVITGVGFSLGGNVLLKYLGEEGSESQISAAVAISVPMSLSKCVEAISTGISNMYQIRLMYCCRETAKRKIRAGIGMSGVSLTEKDVDKLRNFRDFDNAITCKVYGFRDCDHYYETTSCRPFLSSIGVPTLIVNARDDPFMARNDNPSHDELSPFVQFQVTKHGGHCGFMEGTLPWKTSYYMEGRAAGWFEDTVTGSSASASSGSSSSSH